MSKKKSGFHMMATTGMLCEGKSTNFVRLMRRYGLLAKNRYRWTNLPQGIESRHIEEFLYEHGMVMFFEDADLGKLTLPCSDTGFKNVYGDSLSYTVHGHGYSKIVTTDDGVIIRNNDDCLPNIIDIVHYCNKIDELEYAIQRNIDQQNSPYMFACDKNTELTVKQMMNKIRNKEDAIFFDKTLTETGELGMVKEDISKPYIGAELQNAKEELERELLTLLGLNTVINKESGMAATELNSNNSHIRMNLDIEFKNREMAAEEINAKFGLNIKVEKVIEEIALEDEPVLPQEAKIKEAE